MFLSFIYRFSVNRLLPSSLSQKTGRTVEYMRSGQVHLGVVQAVPTAKSVDLKDIDGTKHRVAPDQLLSLWPVEFGVLPHFGAPVRAPPRDARRLRHLWDRLKDSEATLATADIAHSLYGSLSSSTFALAADLLSRQRIFFKRSVPLGGWAPLSQSASVNAQRVFFREEAELILAGKKASFSAPEHAETLDDLSLYYLSSLYGARGAYTTRQQFAASLLPVFGHARTPESAAQLLIDLGFWGPPQGATPAAYANSAVVRAFTREQRDAAVALHSQPASFKDPSAAVRKDLTSRQSFWARRDFRSRSIALSHEVREDGSSWLLVHLPDLHRWLAPGSALRDCAQQQLSSFAASAYRLPLLPSLAESALGFQSGRTNYAVTVAFSDNVSERKSEIFLSKISPVIEVTPGVLDLVDSSSFPDRLRTFGIGRRAFSALRKVTAAVAPPSTAHESFWTAVSGLRERAVGELRSFLKSMNAPLDPLASFTGDSYLNLLAHDQLHALLSGKPPSVSQDLLHGAKSATDARLSSLTSEFHALTASAPDVLQAQALRQQRLLGIAPGDPVELLGVVLHSGAKGSTLVVHPVNQLARGAIAGESFYPGEFVRAEVDVSRQTIERVTKL